MRKLLLVIPLLALFVSMMLCVNAHPGRTDSKGGHTDRSTGEYHYHHGYSAHSHYDMDGDGDADCPYNFKDTTEHKTESNKNSTSRDSKTHNESAKEQQEEPARSTSSKKIKIDEDIITAIIVALVLVGSWVVWYMFIYERK